MWQTGDELVDNTGKRWWYNEEDQVKLLGRTKA
jgi:hypothetical protein